MCACQFVSTLTAEQIDVWSQTLVQRLTLMTSQMSLMVKVILLKKCNFWALACNGHSKRSHFRAYSSRCAVYFEMCGQQCHIQETNPTSMHGSFITICWVIPVQCTKHTIFCLVGWSSFEETAFLLRSCTQQHTPPCDFQILPQILSIHIEVMAEKWKKNWQDTGIQNKLKRRIQ